MRALKLFGQLIDFIALLFVIVVCAIQIYRITQKYLQYEVVNEIETSQADVITMPDISLCSATNRFINFDLLSLYHPDIVEKAHEIGGIQSQSDFVNWTSSTRDGKDFFHDIVLGKLTVSQILRSSFNESSFFSKLDITSPGNFTFMTNPESYRQCRKSFFIKGISTCASIHCSTDRIYRLTRDDVIRTSGMMARIFIRRNAAISLSRLDIFFHSPNTFPRGLHIPYTSLNIPNTTAGREYSIDFFNIVSYLLPSPYTSKCRNYYGFESQEHRLEVCNSKKSISMINTSFRFSIEMSDSNRLAAYSYFHDIHMDDMKHKRQMYQKITRHCSKVAPNPDCKIELYIPEVRSDLEYRQNQYRIQLMLPTRPHIVNKTRPKMSQSEYVLRILNIILIWYGSHVMFELKKIHDIFHKSYDWSSVPCLTFEERRIKFLHKILNMMCAQRNVKQQNEQQDHGKQSKSDGKPIKLQLSGDTSVLQQILDRLEKSSIN